MSKLLTLGILQQAQNAGGSDDGVLYDGEMTVGSYVLGQDELHGYFSSSSTGSINPTSTTFTRCSIEGDEPYPMTGEREYQFLADYPDIGSVLAHYEFGSTVYTSLKDLFDYLKSENGNTISLKVYEDEQ